MTDTHKHTHAKGNGTLVLRGGIYHARWMLNGKVYSRSTKTGSKREAEAKLREFTDTFRTRDEKRIVENLVTRVKGIDAQIERDREAMPSLGLLAGWMAYLKAQNRPDTGAATLRMYEFEYGRFVTWMQKTHPEAQELRKVTQAMADEFAAHLAATLSPNTHNKYVALLRLMWDTLAANPDARLTANPWKSIRRKTMTPHSRRELTVEELKRVIESLDGEMRLLFAIGIYTGLRLGDCANLGWGSVDLVRGIISTVPRKTARHANGKPVTIPLHRALADLLAETPPELRRGPVLPETAELYTRDSAALSDRIQRTFENCGIKTHAEKRTPDERARVDVGFHSLRHSYVSLCANAGVPLALVQSIVGHTSPAMTLHYFHESQDALKTALVALPDVTAPSAPAEPTDATTGILARFRALADGMTADERKTAMDYLAQLDARRV